MASRLTEVEVKVEPHHLFRYPSEWDPRVDPRGGKRNNTKGGYLEGCIKLPAEFTGQPMLLRLSTVPDYTPKEKAEFHSILQDDYSSEEREEFLKIHPTIIAVIRKGQGMRRDKSKEPVPNVEHNPRDFLVQKQNNQTVLKIINVTSQKDQGRKTIQTEDVMFPLVEENGQIRLRLGKGNCELNLVILIPKTEARCADEDISIDRLLEHRMPGEDKKKARDCLKEFLFTGKKAYNLKKVKLCVEVLSLDGSHMLAGGTSEGITDTGSKTVGALDVKEAHPLISCERGGRKVIMVSEFKDWDKSVKPIFVVKNCDGSYVDQSCVAQPTRVHNDGKVIFFLTPEQNDFHELNKEGRQLRLLAQREDGTCSVKQFPFEYVKHRSVLLDDKCLYCEGSMLDGAVGEMPSAPVSTGPNQKRRRMSTPVATHVPRSSAPTTVISSSLDLTLGGNAELTDRGSPGANVQDATMEDPAFNSTSDILGDLFEPRYSIREHVDQDTTDGADLPTEVVQDLDVTAGVIPYLGYCEQGNVICSCQRVINQSTTPQLIFLNGLAWTTRYHRPMVFSAPHSSSPTQNKESPQMKRRRKKQCAVVLEDRLRSSPSLFSSRTQAKLMLYLEPSRRRLRLGQSMR